MTIPSLLTKLQLIEAAFCNRSISKYETYHQLRCEGVSSSNARHLVQQWDEFRHLVEAVFADGKE